MKKIKFERHYPGYFYRREIIKSGKSSYELVSCYSDLDGSYIGSSNVARALCKKRDLRQLQSADILGTVAQIGFSESLQAWFGWSHRGIFGFSIGDKLFSSTFKGNKIITPFGEHGTITIKTLGQAKTAAKRFARYLS